MDLAGIPFVDGHLHPPLRVLPHTPDELRWPWYEGRPETVARAADLPAYRAGLAALATRLDVEPSEHAVLGALRRRDPAAWLAEAVSWGGVAGLVVDLGYPPPAESLDPATVRRAAGVPVATLLRIESCAGALLEQAHDFDEFLERYDETVGGAREAGHRGLKSVIAYRTGLGVEAVDRDAALEAYRRQRTLGGRLTLKPLLDHLLLRALDAARDQDLPLQLHCGYGDRDLDLSLGNPLLLRPLLESGAADGVPLVLLHACWPYVREGAYLAAVYPDVYLDVASCIPPIGWGEVAEAWRVALSAAPVTRVQASTDAAGLSEQLALGAIWARETLGHVLEGMVGAGALGAAAAEAAAELALAGNARRLYLD